MLFFVILSFVILLFMFPLVWVGSKSLVNIEKELKEIRKIIKEKKEQKQHD